VQRSALAAESSRFTWDADTAATWTLASGGRPGVLWVIGAQDDDTFNRLPPEILALSPMTSDLRIGPETAVAP
jgi:hypothetical protein